MSEDPLLRLNNLLHGEQGYLRLREPMADDAADEVERLRARVAVLEGENAKLRVHPIGVRKQRINDLEQRLIAAIGKADHEKLSAMAFEFHAEQAIDGLADDLHIAQARVTALEAEAKPKPMSEAPTDGTRICAVIEIEHREYDGHRQWECLGPDGATAFEHVGDLIGWLPLSGQGGEGES